MNAIQTVQEIYAAFGRGDVDSILEGLAPDVRWDDDAPPGNPLPFLQPRRSRDEVRGFFQALQALEFTQFQPTRFLADGDLVVVLLDIAFTLKASGRSVAQADEVHIWRFDAQGRVVQFRHRLDTLRVAEAMRGG